jgi:hypothetical protein
MSEKPEPVIVVRLVGVKPELVPLGAMTELIEAIQSLVKATGPNLSIFKIQRKSAAYQLTSPADPGPIVARVKRCAKALSDPDSHLQSYMLRGFDTINRILGALDCYMQVYSPVEKWKWQMRQNEWPTVRERYCLEDDGVLIGELKRVGGASQNKCTIRVPFQKKLIYCHIENPDVARRLGQHLYGEVELRGRGIYFTRDWQLLSFKVTEFVVRKNKSWEDHYRDIREAGGRAWDNISDPKAFLEEMR